MDDDDDVEEELVVMEKGGETMTVDELVKRVTEIEKLTVTMASALANFFRADQQRQRNLRLRSVELVCTIL